MVQHIREYCVKWNLSSPHLIASTISADIYKVTHRNESAVLKIFKDPNKDSARQSALVLDYFKNHAAVKLYDSDETAQLLEYGDGSQLKKFVENKNDEGATSVICDVLRKLHDASSSNIRNIPNGLKTLEENYQSLFLKAKQEPAGSIFRQGAKVAEHLLESEQEIRVLHGDLHHENILFSAKRGWLAIDPKGIYGERTYDVAPAFYNPSGFGHFYTRIETIQRRLQIFAHLLGLDPKRILEFVFSYGCLSAAWKIEDQQNPQETLQVANQVQTILHFGLICVDRKI